MWVTVSFLEVRLKNCKTQGFHPCTPLKGLLEIASQARRKFATGKYCESLKNLQNLKNIIYKCLSSFLESRTFLQKGPGGGIRGQSPLKK
jgi:hypothetical protein